ncbi:MAG: hypothetical protein AB7N71_13845 [Phycisphaerae bacterium]
MAKRTAAGRGPRIAAENDIYTGLIFAAFLFLLAATIYVGYKMVALFGTLLPPGGS